MTDKLFSRNTFPVSHNHWLFGAGSRENAGIFLRNHELRKWCIARSIGRARIETSRPLRLIQMTSVSPDQLVGRGLKLRDLDDGGLLAQVSPDQLVGRGLKLFLWSGYPDQRKYRPINWSGAD